MTNATPNPTRNWGNLGEDFVESVFAGPIGRDFLFRSPIYRTEKGDVELCDLLILLEDTAILAEVKTADRDKRPNRTEEEWAEYANRRMAQAREQIERGVSALRRGSVKSVANDRQGTVSIDPARLLHYFGMAVVDHPTLDKYGGGPVIEVDGGPVCVLTTTHTELGELLRELSTVGDLIDYMRAREEFFAKNSLVGVTELDLLACYKPAPHEFREHVANYDELMVVEGSWDAYAALDARRRRDEADHPSLLVDKIIDRLHESRHTNLPHVERRYAQLGEAPDPSEAYRQVAEALARIRRLDRRIIGKKLIDKSAKCIEQGRDRWFATSPIEGDGATCVFLVSTSDREQRITTLEMRVLAAMLKRNVRRVLGIAIEPVEGGYGSSVDAFLIDHDPEKVRASLPSDVAAMLESEFGSPVRPEETEFD